MVGVAASGVGLTVGVVGTEAGDSVPAWGLESPFTCSSLLQRATTTGISAFSLQVCLPGGDHLMLDTARIGYKSA